MSQTRSADPVVTASPGEVDESDVAETETTEAADAAEEPDEDDLFDLLSNRRRRYALHYLKQRGGTVELRDLAEQVAAWEYDSAVRDLDRRERKRVKTALHQFHLPKMDDVGVVEYDARLGRVRPAPAASDLECYLDVVAGGDLPWSGYYLGLSVLCGVVVGLAWAGVPPFGLVPPLGWAAVVVAVVGASAVGHGYHSRQRRLGADGPPPEVRR
ncbi:DUF7344 domain-containing protein [Halomarina litorea]|uniref:DUF7344 domain-containing protein n=1 Tax=Halomarina litorea TaxID=2961595 RepID=UPI0020C4D036|nr:hypothetical protein [Halomarina sp. BCD28]